MPEKFIKAQFAKGNNMSIPAVIKSVLLDFFTNQIKKNPKKAYSVKISPGQKSAK